MSALFAWIPLNCLDPVEPERQSAYEAQSTISLNNSFEGCNSRKKVRRMVIILLYAFDFKKQRKLPEFQ